MVLVSGSGEDRSAGENVLDPLEDRRRYDGLVCTTKCFLGFLYAKEANVKGVAEHSGYATTRKSEAATVAQAEGG